MYLGKHDAYSVLNTLQAHLAVVILPCCNWETTSCAGTKCSCKNFPVNLNVDLYTLRLLSLRKTCSKVRNSVFATHSIFDTLDVVHTGGTQPLFLKLPHLSTPSTTFWPIVRIVHISQEMYTQFSLVLMCELDIDASTWYLTWTFSLINCWNFATTK